MKTLELFCGTKSFSKVAEKYGCGTTTIDIDQSFNPTICSDIFYLTIDEIGRDYDLVWASPPCEGFSVATIGKNWRMENGKPLPKSGNAVKGYRLLLKTLEIINEINPRYWFIENPRCMMRKMKEMQKLHRKTVTYCQYGDTRMKPTDIWTNFVEWETRPPCKNGSPCHVAAPRGSRTGTQGLKGSKERGIIPPKLFEELFSQLDKVK